MSQTLRHYLVLIVVASAVLFTNLGGPRLWDRDEPRNAGCAAEMLALGDWVTPLFNGELRTHKPVLLYWFMMTAYGMFGVNEFAARFWSAALGVATVLATYGIGRRLFGPRIGLWAGVILSTSLMFDVAARAATPDSVLIFFSTAPILVYVLSVFKPRGAAADGALELKHESFYFPKSWPAAVLMYALMGVAVLAKGPVGLVLPTAVIGMFLLIMRLPAANADDSDSIQQTNWLLRAVRLLRPFAPLHFLRTCWSMRPFTALAAALAVALPWYIWVGLRTDGEWLRGFFLEHNLGRATQAMEGHSGGVWFYPVALLVGFFPWSVLMAPLLIDAVRRVRTRTNEWPGYVLALCWVGVYVGLFSVAKTKLPSYVTPCYPGLALLAGCFVFHWSRGSERAAKFWPYVSFGCLALVGGVVLVAVPLAAREILPGEEWLGALGLIPLGGGIAGWLLTARGNRPGAAAALSATSILVMTAAFSFVLWRVDRHQQFGVLLSAIDSRTSTAQVGALGALEPSWSFYGGRTVYLIHTDERARMNIDGESAPDYRRLAVTKKRPWDANPSFYVLDFLNSSPDAFVITTREQFQKIESQLPPHVAALAETPYFLKDHHLVVLGWNDEAARLARSGRPPHGGALR